MRMVAQLMEEERRNESRIGRIELPMLSQLQDPFNAMNLIVDPNRTLAEDALTE